MADILQIGERRIVDVSTLIILGGYASGNPRFTLRQPTGSSGYAVPVGSSLRILGISIHAAIAAGVNLSLGYSDNDVGFNSATAFTNPHYQFEDSNFLIFRNAGTASTGLAPGMPQSFATDFTVPTGKYPGFNYIGGANSVHVVVYGKLI